MPFSSIVVVKVKCFVSSFDLANRGMNDTFPNDLGTNGISSLMNLDPNTKVFSSSSVDVVQISHGSDNHRHIVQAHHERRIGPDDVWQTKRRPFVIPIMVLIECK